MKVKLVFPAFWVCNSPYLSVPSLAAYLQKHGVDVAQMDLNLAFYDKILSQDFLTHCVFKLCLNKKIIKTNSLSDMQDFALFAASKVEYYKQLYKSKAALDVNTYEECVVFFNACFSIVSSVYKNENVNFFNYAAQYDEFKSNSILKCADSAFFLKHDSLLNTLTSFFIDDVVKDADFIGISLTSIEQILPTFALAASIKRKAPHIKIVIGGSIPSRWFADSLEERGIFKYIDYVIVNEGEEALLKLVQTLEANGNLSDVPQLVYKNDSGVVVKNKIPAKPFDINSLPAPVFNKEDIPRYFSPLPTLPLLSCRGCYWKKCAFCDHSFIYNDSYRKRTTAKVIKDITEYKELYGAHYIHFHDEAVSPLGLKEIAESLIEHKIDITWTADARLDSGLTKDILTKARQSGLRVLFFGLESINPRVLKLINKGIEPDSVKRILTDTAALQIWAHLFFICGFPTETAEEFGQTVSFIEENKEIIGSTGNSTFGLGKFSPVAFNPDFYQVKILENKNDLSFIHNFKRQNDPISYKKDIYKLRKKAHAREMGYFQKQSLLFFREHWPFFHDHLLQEKQNPPAEKELQLASGLFMNEKDGMLNVYNCSASSLLQFDKSALVIFNFIKKYGELEPVIKAACKEFNISQEEARPQIETFIALLREKKLLQSNKKKSPKRAKKEKV